MKSLALLSCGALLVAMSQTVVAAKLNKSEATGLCSAAVASANSEYNNASIKEMIAPTDHATRVLVTSVYEEPNMSVTGRELIRVEKFCRKYVSQLNFTPKLGKKDDGLKMVDVMPSAN